MRLNSQERLCHQQAESLLRRSLETSPGFLLSSFQFPSLFVKGAVAKWQGKGLQNLHRRFDSASRLQFRSSRSGVRVIPSEVSRAFGFARSAGTRSRGISLRSMQTPPDLRFSPSPAFSIWLKLHLE